MAESVDSNFIRTQIKVQDDGVYINDIVTHYLLDTTMVLGDDYDICDDKQLTSTVNVFERFKDKNRPGTAVMSYWEQKLNETSGLWEVNPASAASLFPYVNRFLNFVNRIINTAQLKLTPNHEALLNLT